MPRPPEPPPAIREPAVRLVFSDVGLPELFVRAATDGGASAELVHVDELADRLRTFLTAAGANRIAVGPAPLLQKVGVPAALAAAGFQVVGVNVPADAAVTGVALAVGETGSIGLPTTAGWWLRCSLRLAVLEPKNFVPDLIDWSERAGSAPTLVSGRAAGTLFVLQ